MTSSDLLVLPETSRNSENVEALFFLLEERSRRYTMGDSTSLPLDTAQRLLGSILYCLELNRRFPAQGTTELSIEQRWSAGEMLAKNIAKRAKLLLMQVSHTPPPLVNTGYCDTLSALPGFFARYDADFFAQEVPCSFDYPLCHPVDESLSGAEYMREYLRRLLCENTFLRAFSPDALRALYTRYYIDYSDLLVNLFLPAAEMAALCAIAGEPVRALSLSQPMLQQLGRKIAAAAEEEAREMITCAAARTLAELKLNGALLRGYLEQTALDFLTRLRASK